MKNPIKFITIAIFISISFLTALAQESTVAIVNESPETTEKVEKKETPKKQSTDDDSWTGFYVGGFGGFTIGRANPTTSTTFISGQYFAQASILELNKAGNQRLKPTGFNGGGTIGYNYQKNKFFVGAEVDFGANRVNKTVTSAGTYPCCTQFGFTITQTVKSDWMLTARPRVGIATKKALIYFTAGVAVTNIKYTGKFTDTFASAIENGSFNKTKAGWTAGAGMEFKVNSRWSVKGEYLFSQFGRNSITSTDFSAGNGPNNSGNQDVFTTNVFNHSVNLNSNSFRFGVNYRF